MSIRTTVTLDEGVYALLKEACAAQGVPFRKLLNDVLRSELRVSQVRGTNVEFKICPVSMGAPMVGLEKGSAAIEEAEGSFWR